VSATVVDAVVLQTVRSDAASVRVALNLRNASARGLYYPGIYRSSSGGDSAPLNAACWVKVQKLRTNLNAPCNALFERVIIYCISERSLPGIRQAPQQPTRSSAHDLLQNNPICPLDVRY
jgi:hypothetical protein